MATNKTFPQLKFLDYSLSIIKRAELEELYHQAKWIKVNGSSLSQDIKIKNKDLWFKKPINFNQDSEFNGVVLVGDGIEVNELNDKINTYKGFNHTFLDIEDLSFNGENLNVPNIWLPFTYIPRGNLRKANLKGANLTGLRIYMGNVSDTNFKYAILENALWRHTQGSLENSSLERELNSIGDFERVGKYFYGILNDELCYEMHYKK